MVTAETPTPTIECAIPNWLQECLLTQEKEGRNCAADVGLICRAFEFAYNLHKEQRRASGEPYICHPVAVAELLRDLGGGSAMIAAGFLHDIVEDTEVTPEEIETRFGSEVRYLVEGVTKLSKFNFSSKTERQAENFRRMFLSMAQDIRVIVVKLADRLHNMRTLEHLADEKRRRIARETREIFAPLANRLGIGRIKWELEDLCFKYLEPEAYQEIQELVSEKRATREARLANVAEMLRHGLENAGINYKDINGRPKHLYGIYQKMHRQQKEFHEIYDIAAIRMIVSTVDECYRALAVVHNAFKPIPGRFKDYIGLPKPNRYQSLHTAVVGLTGRPLEVQIRTLEMHQIAEYGIAAHWKYKESGGSKGKLTEVEERFTWLRQLLEWQSDLKDAQEYLENVKDNLFDDEVYAFTPKGDVVPLTHGATPVDFAYRIHTEVGNRCSGARVNGRMVTLDTQLKNGDIVEILTKETGRPSLDWLNFAVTTGARNRIRQWYKRSRREENIARGRELLEKELGKKGLDALLKSPQMQGVAEKANYHSVDDLLAGLGYGEVTQNQVVNRLRDAVKETEKLPLTPATIAKQLPATSSESSSQSTSLPSCGKQSPILGIEGLVYHLAGCCNPLPGEGIIGVVTRSSNRGISIHRQGCNNVEGIPGDRLVPVSWNPDCSSGNRPQTYPVNLQIEVLDRVGIFKDILSRLSDQNINVRKAGVKTDVGKPALIDLCVEIRDRQQLERIFSQIKQMSDILNLRRLTEGEELMG
jgi:GTP pyrophosphokinase